jgi:hypothetical protein
LTPRPPSRQDRAPKGTHHRRRRGATANWQHAGVPGEVVTTMMVKGFINRDPAGEIRLTDSGRSVLRAMLGEL